MGSRFRGNDKMKKSDVKRGKVFLRYLRLELKRIDGDLAPPILFLYRPSSPYKGEEGYREMGFRK